jgi:hypothetical protein
MLARLPLLTTVRMWAALLLAAIGLQALEPIATPLQLSHGSAFGATTYEAALAPQRRNVAEGQKLVPLSPTLPAIRSVPDAFAMAPPPAPRPDSTGPPARMILAREAPPRAPPLA